MLNTAIYLHNHAADKLNDLGRPEAIIQFINRLESNPETLGDYRQPDPRGRMLEVKILGRYAILFFNDPYAGLIKILDIRNTEAI